LVGAPGPGNGLLDLGGRVFGNLQPLLRRCHDRGPPRLPELECGIGIARHEYLLDAHGYRAVQANHLADPGEHCLQSGGQLATARADTARRHILAIATGIADDAVAGDARAGVDPEDKGHASAILSIYPAASIGSSWLGG